MSDLSQSGDGRLLPAASAKTTILLIRRSFFIEKAAPCYALRPTDERRQRASRRPVQEAEMKEPLLSGQFEYALAYAAHVHRAQPRKGTDLPYAGHLLSVAGIVLHNGGTEQEAIAALLHDAPEDQGGHARLQDIASQFGPQVARIVEACSDSLEQDPEKKEEWRPRKERYLRHLRENPDQSVYLVSAADKLDNARATLAEWLEGVPVWNRFKVGREETLWLYDELITIYEAGPPDKRRAPIVRELKETVVKLKTDANQAARFEFGE